jgi:hypothetical protein
MDVMLAQGGALARDMVEAGSEPAGTLADIGSSHEGQHEYENVRRADPLQNLAGNAGHGSLR